MSAKVSRHVASLQSPFQQIDFYDTEVFGRVLTLDGHIQLTSFDERAYHEALVQVPMLSLPNPRRALVIGGGDGGVLRELCRHRSMEHIDLVEIDEEVIRLCREHMPKLSDGAFDDSRVHVHVGDAFPFVKQDMPPYDLIVADSTDVYEEEDGSLSEQLFTVEFYRDCARLLSPHGILVTQADNLVFCPYSLETVRSLFAQAFPVVGSYQALVPSFGGFSGFCWASHGASIAREWPEPAMHFSYIDEVTYALAFTPLRFG